MNDELAMYFLLNEYLFAARKTEAETMARYRAGQASGRAVLVARYSVNVAASNLAVWQVATRLAAAA
jgi:hypothetical protein